MFSVFQSDSVFLTSRVNLVLVQLARLFWASFEESKFYCMANGLFQAWIIGATVESQSWKEEATQDVTRIWRGVLSAEWKVCWAEKQMLDSSFAFIAKCFFRFLRLLPSEIWSNLYCEQSLEGGNIMILFCVLQSGKQNGENESSIRVFSRCITSWSKIMCWEKAVVFLTHFNTFLIVFSFN